MGRNKESEITPLQKETLDEISRYINEKGYPPTVKELSEIFNISHASVHDRISQLVRKGYLKRENGKARGLAITELRKTHAVSLVSIPIAGTVAAGQPIFAQENITGEILVEASVVGSGKFFALYAKGNSMINAGINDGDLIIVRRQPIAENGDIVIALLGDEATVKRLHIKDSIIKLVPENPDMIPITVEPEDDLIILGKVVGRKQL